MGWGSANGVGPLEKFSQGQQFSDCVKVGISVSFSDVSLTTHHHVDGKVGTRQPYQPATV